MRTNAAACFWQKAPSFPMAFLLVPKLQFCLKMMKDKERRAISGLWPVLQSALTQWWQGESMQLGAALAYYVVFSLGPCLLILVLLVGSLFGEAAAKGVLFHHLSGALGPEVARAAESIIADAQKQGGTFVSVAGLGALIFGATTIFAQLKFSLNRLWEVAATEKGSAVWIFVKRRAVAFLMLLSLGAMLLVLIAADTTISALSQQMVAQLPFSKFVLRLASLLLSALLLTLILAGIYKFLPDAQVCWSAVWKGAGISAILFVLGKYFLSLYLGKTSTASLYGAAGSVIVILVAAYFFSQILFLGAYVAKCYSVACGKPIEPLTKGA